MADETNDVVAEETAPETEAAPEVAEEAAPAEVAAPAPVAQEKVEVEVPEKFKELVHAVEKMTVLELNELVKTLEKKFGVSAQAVAVAGPAAGGAAAEEKSDFAVELTSFGDQKIAVIKIVKEVLGLGLAEAKTMVESAPVVLKTEVKKEDAEAWKKKIEEAGGKVTLK